MKTIILVKDDGLYSRMLPFLIDAGLWSASKGEGDVSAL